MIPQQGVYLLAAALLFSAVSAMKRLAVVTGGTRGIGRGIVERLIESGDYEAFILTYNSNHEAAQEFKASHNDVRLHLVAGDLSLVETRDAIFQAVDKECSDCQLGLMVHNAGLYVGVTSGDTSDGYKPVELQFGNGSLLDDNGRLQTDTMRYYQKLYGEAYIDLCERSLARMRTYDDKFRGCLVGISSPGCNILQRPMLGYSMPSSGKCIMEHTSRLFAQSAASNGVNCNVIIPGVTETEAWVKLAESRGGKSDDLLNRVAKSVPYRDPIVDPKAIGDVVEFLSRPGGGGRFITGQSICVDGGLTTLR